MQHDTTAQRDSEPPNGRRNIWFALFYGFVLPWAFLLKVYYAHSRIAAVVFAILGIGILLDAVRHSSTTLDRDGIRQWSPLGRRCIAWRDVATVHTGPRFIVLRSRDARVAFMRWRFVDDAAVVSYILRRCKEARKAMTSVNAPDRSSG